MNVRLRLREGEKLATGHTAEPGLKYSAGRGEPSPCLPRLPHEAPPTKPRVRPPQLSPPERQTLTLQTTVGAAPAQQLPPLGLSKATLSDGATGRGQAWPRMTHEKGGNSRLRLAATSIPTPNVPAPVLSGSGMPPPGPSVHVAGSWLPFGRGMRVCPCHEGGRRVAGPQQ